MPESERVGQSVCPACRMPDGRHQAGCPALLAEDNDLNARGLALTGFWVGALTGSLLLAVVLAILGGLK